MLKRAIVSIRGVVQGVGFRPFVYRLAMLHDLRGWVRNTSGEVEIEAEGSEAEIAAFLNDLKTQAPPAAQIETMRVKYAPPLYATAFTIRESHPEEGDYQLISPDIATCADCRREIFDAADRRHGYAFTNCTNCGPRFTIIEDIPYDRPRTTMRDFIMCPTCRREYDDPLDRRFHAQPNACPVCGPRLQLIDAGGKEVTADDPIETAAGLLRGGQILAVRGLGGFQLACDATSNAVVDLLRVRKHRLAKPFAIMFATLAEANKRCRITAAEAELLQSPQSPVVLVDWRKERAGIAPSVAPGLNYLGVMLPYTPLHHLLLAAARIPLVMTSGNLSEEPIAKDNDEALARLAGIADYFLLHNRGIYARYDDSVFIVEQKRPVVVRRARGYAPHPVTLPYRSRQILACGAELKNTFCLTRDNHAFVSQHIGDMENAETLDHFENTVELYKRLFRIQPELIACDLHPEYLPTKYAIDAAQQLRVPLVRVQHHHAHIASCLAENGVESAIGVAFDGVGYGTDGALWGGEFLVANAEGFDRLGQLEYVPMPGGAAAIRKPYRMACGYLFSLIGKDYDVSGLPLKLDSSEAAIIGQQIARNLNAPLTSSMGRLFDAVAALAGVRQEVSYEAQAAIELEMLAAGASRSLRRAYPFKITESQDLHIVKLVDLLLAVVDDVRKGVPVPEISMVLHNTVAKMAVDMCRLIAAETGLNRVALSGGCFQNRLLLRLTRGELEKARFDVVMHREVPCNDGGISLGQAVIANFAKAG